MDTRIGYPNEHLGKSKVDAVKSPMHATGVGLVLAGYQSLDQRTANLIEVPQQVEYKKPVTKTVSKDGSGIGLFQKLKGFLSDDIDNDKQNY
jgi:cell division protein FtsA